MNENVCECLLVVSKKGIMIKTKHSNKMNVGILSVKLSLNRLYEHFIPFKRLYYPQTHTCPRSVFCDSCYQMNTKPNQPGKYRCHVPNSPSAVLF